MNKTLSFIAALVMTATVASASPAHAASAGDTGSDSPIITFKTNIYDTYGETNSFSIVLGSTTEDYFDIDYGFGQEEVSVSPAYYDPDRGTIVGTTVSCRVSADGLVKIYGDASKIDYFCAIGCYIDWIDIDACRNLEILDLSHNELKSLDLSNHSKLRALYLSDNTFTPETPLLIGGNKPSLQILEIDIVDYIDQSFNLSDYPSLVSFDAYHCTSLRNADPTGCPALQVMSLELTPVSSLDVSRNPDLVRLNISDTRITDIDISKNTRLVNFLAQHTSGTINTDVKLKSVDVSANTSLVLLDLAGNDLESVDLSRNAALTNLNLRYNRIKNIDLSANVNLYSVNLAYNDLDFATLPLPDPQWGEYYYFRHPMSCAKSYAKDAEIDFSSRVCREGGTTTVRVWRDPLGAEPSLLDESLYSFADGKISFNEVTTDSVYVEFINSLFPEYTIRSGAFVIKEADQIGKPSAMIRMTPAVSQAGREISFRLALTGASADEPRNLYVAFDGAEAVPYPVSSDDIQDMSVVSFALPAEISGPVTLAVDEGVALTGFEIDGVKMTAIDLSAATELQRLKINNSNLVRVDLSTNRCLRSLELSNNRLGTLDLKGVFGDYEKNALEEVIAPGNYLANFEIVSTIQLRKLNLSGNRLSSIVLKNYDNLEELDLSDNRIDGILNLAYLGNARRIDIHKNSIDSITVVAMPELEYFDISDNNLSIRNVPYIPELGREQYLYAPQKPLTISEKAPGVNLSSQYRVIDGKATAYVWKKADGTLLVDGEHYVCKNGATRFLDENLGKVYCEMTHEAFPAFEGENVFVTTETEVVGAPTNVIASFTTTENSDHASVIFTGTHVSDVFIDWQGDGMDYVQYPVNGETYSAYENQRTYAGAKVKVYTYESADDIKVFSVYDAKMSEIDASPLTSVVSFNIGGAGIDESDIVFPASPDIMEMNLQDNSFSTSDFSAFPKLKSLVLTGNRYTSFDASKLPAIETLILSRNELTDIKLAGNSSLWGLDLSSNKLSEIDLSGAPAISQLIVNDNEFEAMDLSPLKSSLRALDITGNAFRFSTLPDASQFPGLMLYRYSNQKRLPVELVDGKIDLSSEAEINGIATEYHWFIGDVVIDNESGTISGEELVGDGDDPEYTIGNGVTTFHYSFDEMVTGALVNSGFEKLVLLTNPVAVLLSGIENVFVEGEAADADAPLDVYSVSGQLVRRGVKASEATEGLAPGFYIVGGKKCYVR